MNKYGNYECYIARTPITDDKEMCIGACTKDTSKNIIMLIVVAKKVLKLTVYKDSRADRLYAMCQLIRRENCKPTTKLPFL